MSKRPLTIIATILVINISLITSYSVRAQAEPANKSSSAAAASETAVAPESAAAPVIDAATIDAYLVGKGSPMAGQGPAFVASGGRWQIDPRLLVAIAGAESSFGAITCAPFNAWGWGCPNGPYHFSSWADGIDAVAKGLRTGYLSEGRISVAQINLKYAPIGAANDPTGLNNHWTANVSRFLIELGGNPNNIDASGVAGQAYIGAAQTNTNGLSFSVEESFAAENSSEIDSPKPLTVGADRPAALSITLRNTGTEPWNTENVRLLRVDNDQRIHSAPYAALEKTTKPQKNGRFVINLLAANSSACSVETRWRVESIDGVFGDEIVRRVKCAPSAFLSGKSEVEVAPAATENNEWNIIVRVQNIGQEAWLRGGESSKLDREASENSGVKLVYMQSIGGPFKDVNWPEKTVAAHLLEREVEPGDWGSFAFKIAGNNGAIALQLHNGEEPIAGQAIIAELGAVTANQLDELRAAVP